LSLFVDTSAWYAAADRSDVSNARAKQLLSGDEPRVTTDHVLIETWWLLQSRLGRSAAVKFWEGLRGGVAALETVGMADLEAAWSIASAFPDQDFSIVECTSFAVMQRLGLRRVVSFDDDFAVYRFGRDRKDAFVVLR
jgi:predicted nucleic acid-binding protein